MSSEPQTPPIDHSSLDFSNRRAIITMALLLAAVITIFVLGHQNPGSAQETAAETVSSSPVQTGATAGELSGAAVGANVGAAVGAAAALDDPITGAAAGAAVGTAVGVASANTNAVLLDDQTPTGSLLGVWYSMP